MNAVGAGKGPAREGVMSPSGTAGLPPTPVFFLAGGTGISAETLGNLIINQFPTVAFGASSRRR